MSNLLVLEKGEGEGAGGFCSQPFRFFWRNVIPNERKMKGKRKKNSYSDILGFVGVMMQTALLVGFMMLTG